MNETITSSNSEPQQTSISIELCLKTFNRVIKCNSNFIDEFNIGVYFLSEMIENVIYPFEALSVIP